MRRGLWLLVGAAGIALWACVPKLDGASCVNDSNCPKEQACTQGRCVSRCTAGCDPGLICVAGSGGAHACVCPANNSSDFYADPGGGGHAQVAPFATGVGTPAACRFKTLGEALQVAQAYVAAVPAEQRTARVLASDDGSGGGQRYESETFPLEIPDGITLGTSGPSLADGGPVIQYRSGAGAALKLHPGALVTGFTVQNDVAATADPAITFTACGDGGLSQVSGVRILGQAAGGVAMPAGVEIAGPCNVLIASPDISGTQAGIDIRVTPSGRVQVQGGRVSGNTHGIVVASGMVALAGVAVEGNAGTGLLVGFPGAGGVVSGGSFQGNGDAGVLVVGGALSLTGATLSGNGQGLVVLDGGSAQVQDSHLDSNQQSGLSVSQASATVSGTCSISRNQGDGVSLDVGQVTLTGDGGTFVIAQNGGNGARVVDTVFTAQGISFQDNGATGVTCFGDDGRTHPAVFQACSFGNAQDAGVLLSASALGFGHEPDGGYWLTVDGCTFTGGATGMDLGGGGLLSALARNNRVTGASNTGLIVSIVSGSTVAIVGNDITGNDSAQTTDNAPGGVWINGGNPVELSFQGNRIHGNHKAQVVIEATGVWDLSAPGCGSTSNSIYCYDKAGYSGLVTSTHVLAGGVFWANTPPAGGTTRGLDFEVSGAGMVDAGTPLCAALACP